MLFIYLTNLPIEAELFEDLVCLKSDNHNTNAGESNMRSVKKNYTAKPSLALLVNIIYILSWGSYIEMLINWINHRANNTRASGSLYSPIWLRSKLLVQEDNL